MAQGCAERGGCATRFAWRGFAVAIGFVSLIGVAQSARADWWSENVEFHGKLSSTIYFNAPSLNNAFQMDQWWNQVEIDGDFKLINGEDNSLSFHAIVLPTYDLAYDLYPKLLGDRRQSAAFGTSMVASFVFVSATMFAP